MTALAWLPMVRLGRVSSFGAGDAQSQVGAHSLWLLTDALAEGLPGVGGGEGVHSMHVPPCIASCEDSENNGALLVPITVRLYVLAGQPHLADVPFPGIGGAIWDSWMEIELQRSESRHGADGQREDYSCDASGNTSEVDGPAYADTWAHVWTGGW